MYLEYVSEVYGIDNAFSTVTISQRTINLSRHVMRLRNDFDKFSKRFNGTSNLTIIIPNLKITRFPPNLSD